MYSDRIRTLDLLDDDDDDPVAEDLPEDAFVLVSSAFFVAFEDCPPVDFVLVTVVFFSTVR